MAECHQRQTGAGGQAGVISRDPTSVLAPLRVRTASTRRTNPFPPRIVSGSSVLALGSAPRGRFLASRLWRAAAFLKRPDIAHDAIDGDGVTVFIEPQDL